MSKNLTIAAAVAVAFAILPFVLTERYMLGQVIVFFIWAMVAINWNVLMGHAGVFSLAQLFFFAVGAYGTAMLVQLGGLPIWLAIPVALFVTLIVSILVGLASLRLTGAYVALLTFAIVEMVHILIVTDTACFTSMNGGCQQLFGGATGFSRFEDFGSRKLLGADWLLGNYYIVYAVFVLTLFAMVLVIHGKLGLVFRALRDNPGYASSRGINRLKMQMIVFGITATLTGLAGAVYAGHFRFAGPSLFDFSALMFVLAMVVVGGMGSTWGPLIGAGAMIAVAEIAKEFGDARSLALGLALVLFVLFLPRGLAAGFNQLLAHSKWQ